MRKYLTACLPHACSLMVAKNVIYMLNDAAETYGWHCSASGTVLCRIVCIL